MSTDPSQTWPVFTQQESTFKLNTIYDVAPSFLGDLASYFTANPFPVPIGQVQGFDNALGKAITAFSASVTASNTTASGTYVDLATPGPSVSGLPDGTYVVLFGCMAKNTVASNSSRMGVQVDGAAVDDTNNAAAVGTVDYSGISFAFTTTLSGGTAHALNCQYRVNSGTGTFAQRYIVAIKIG